MKFTELKPDDEEGIREMSAMATEIVREHFDPIVGKEENDYMIGRFQTVPAIREQLQHGYNYYFIGDGRETIGFLAFYPKEEVMYLSKFYLYKEHRGKGYSRPMLDFVIRQTKSAALPAIELNVSQFNDAVHAYEKLGFKRIREEINDIGGGFSVDDYVYRLELD